jgi:murein DD-endopeptidase MepM/ murein hydrolase activator NlpD
LLALLLLAACAGAPPPEPEVPPVPAPGPAAPPEPDAGEEPPPGVFHRIERGQTLFTIARTYGVAMDAIVEANGIADRDRIEAGGLLFIPGAATVLDVPATALPRPAPEVRLLSPADGPVRSAFGPRGGRMHYGVDIDAAAGSKVRAAADGTVLYAGSSYRGYGQLVILDHGDGVRTLYAHNRRLLASTGQTVRAGEVIAEVGGTGNASAPHLHFEVRLGGRPVDPAPFLGTAPG